MTWSTGRERDEARPERRCRFGIWPLIAAWALSACAPGERVPNRDTYAFRGATMGTYYAVKVVAVDLSQDRLGEIQSMIEGELEAVNAKMSTYLETSELSRFNRRAETTSFEVSAETFEVVTEALRVAQLTGGAYDVTVGPLVDAWGFGAGEDSLDLSDEEIRQFADQVGYSKLELDADSRTLRKVQADLYVDLSSLAKGHAVDRVAEALATDGHTDVWVEVGGEVRAFGLNGEGNVWRLGIERPQLEPGTLQRIVPLERSAVATSGDYRNYHERDGARISHIIDPRTGSPVRHRLASVSVIHESCMTADALATALMVLGPEEGWDLAVRERLAVLFLVREGDGFSERMTPTFETLISPPTGGQHLRGNT